MTEQTHKSNDILKSMLDSQQRFFDMWKKNMLLFQPDNTQSNLGEPFERMMKFWQDAFRGNGNNTMQMPMMPMPFANTNQNMPSSTNDFFTQWFKSMPLPMGVDEETSKKIFNDSSNLLNQLYEFWNTFLSGPQNFDPNRLNQVTRDMMDNYNQTLQQFFALNLPEPLRTFFQGSIDVNKAFNDTMQNFTKPWMESFDNFHDSTNRAVQGDQSALNEFFRTWHEAFQNSYGKVFNIPAMGFSRETNEKIQKSIEAYLEYVYSTNEFSLSLYKVGYDAMDKLMSKIQEENEKGNPPKTFKEFYDLWIETNEEVYLNLFNQESFAKMLGNLVDAGVTFKRRHDDLVMEALNELPIPTDHDMDSVYSKIYELNKQVKDHKKTIENLQAELKEMKMKSKHI
ncbi:poly(R)-hydroxyalkanoic acid synthase subunit PhaE [Natranaerofaba carboxydovora]|uniref:poly(R)-hydroxyalkanoic acid synthase subunit PhaE n=1 Tax=Natranaerofaba carboxydovora TaxID=2742683 RepID=UPI001F1488E1|nr:poly(R)-hydroxyalkanoic acid synthase subunit PhaE [Natranaerofaba carboxydovora]UMZ74137.1 Poly(3-hydroxyalkanoate) polymerase subunit PhaE [Natranaerofaba carboxydovora]